VATRGLLVVIFTYGAKSFFEDFRKYSSEAKRQGYFKLAFAL
jgi:hypothetical protein